MYVAAKQSGAGAFSLVVRTGGDPAALLPTLPRAFGDVRPGLPVTRLDAFEAQIADALAAARITAWLMGAFAGLALLLATLGIYAAVSFSVERRTHEIGLRAALGATASQLVGMVIGGSLRTAGIGVAAGLGLAVLAAQGMRSILFGVAPFDALSFTVAALLLLGATALAALIPARRASLTSPSDVLRNS
jgi:ABC-type antimicrobial peptide transport system permease subunit